LITQPDLGKPGGDCLRERARPRTPDKRLAVNHSPPPPGLVTALSCSLSLGQSVDLLSALSACS
ncbi:hypothetical protein KUCAC02_006267, partial [Chaenocephalus aceratus]